MPDSIPIPPATVRIEPLLDQAGIDALREALGRARYTVDGVVEALGLAGAAALARGDLSGAQRATRGDDPVQTLIRLFMLGGAVSGRAAAAALEPLGLARAAEAGLIDVGGDSVRAAVDLRPYGEDDIAGAAAGSAGIGPGAARDPAASGDGSPWWVASDLGSDVRPGPLRADHVLGIGSAALTLAQATPRSAVASALDVGTGCGIQALHLGRHAGAVTATDLSGRALRMAATTAALSGATWDLRAGDLLGPVAGERFDLVVANPPFVVGPGWGTDAGGALGAARSGFDYRDSGAAGDALCERLVRGLPAALAPGGTAQLLANWIIPADGDWAGRLSGWLRGSGCDAWIWQREIADLGEYAALWLRDAGELPGTESWTRRYAQWLDWFEAAGVLAVGMGLVTMRRVDAAHPTVVCEDVPQAVQQPIGGQIAAWLDRCAWLRGALASPDGAATGPDSGPLTVDRLLDARLRAAPDLVLTTHAMPGATGWEPAVRTLRQGGGMRWELEADEALAALIAGSTGTATLAQLVDVLAVSVGVAPATVAQALAPIVVDLIRRGFLLPT